MLKISSATNQTTVINQNKILNFNLNKKKFKTPINQSMGGTNATFHANQLMNIVPTLNEQEQGANQGDLGRNWHFPNLNSSFFFAAL